MTALPPAAPPRLVTVAAIQMACSTDTDSNIQRAEALVRAAAAKGARIILLQELFATTYFCIEQLDSFRLAVEHDDAHSYVARFQALAKELGVVLPISYFERANNAHFNSLVVFDADGRSLGRYRKSHIPDSPGYHEKWHFSPGDSGFKVFHSRYGTIGVAICWDQWFPEAARVMALAGAEVLFYPTAIGSEPQDAGLDSSGHWTRCMQGHAAANIMPVVASNRIGREVSPLGGGKAITFYGSSFICDGTGEVVQCAGREEEAVLTHTFDLSAVMSYRLNWGVFRDRRPDLYGPILTLGGEAPAVAAASGLLAGGFGGRGGGLGDVGGGWGSGGIGGGVGDGGGGIGGGGGAGEGESDAAGGFFMDGKAGANGVEGGVGANSSTANGLISALGDGAIGATAGCALSLGPISNNAAAAAAAAAAVAAGSLAIMAPHVGLAAVAQLGATHEATFIGAIRAARRRRPRGRCWVCQAKTTYECASCVPGPVPICNRAVRDCWWRYHSGQVALFVPSVRGSAAGQKRSRSGEEEEEEEGDDEEDESVDADAAVPATKPESVDALLADASGVPTAVQSGA